MATDAVFIRIDDRELMAAVRMLGSKLGRKNLIKAMRRGADIWKKEAVNNVPVEYGRLKKDLKLRQRVSFESIDISVGNSRAGAHAKLVELGTAPHKVPPPGSSKKKAKPQRHKPHRFVVNHPGARPNPYLRPAFDRKHVETLEKVKEMLRKYIAKVTAKYGGKL